MTQRHRSSPRLTVLVLALVLAACTRATSGFVPVSGTDVVDDSYAVLRQSWNTGDVFFYAFRLRNHQGRAALCGAVGRAPSGGLRGMLDDRAMRSISVRRGDATVVSGIGFFAGPYEQEDLRGRSSNCVATHLPWSADMADPSDLRFAGSSLIFL